MMRCFNSLRQLSPLLLGLLLAAPVQAQLPERLRDYPLGTPGAAGEAVAPMFNGWVKNEDGSTTMVFGFANQNREAIVDVPLGPNNKLEPEQFQGAQPTHFPVYNRGGFVGIQERGAFAVNVPADMAGTEVIWTLASGGKTYSIPGRATSPAYEMSNAKAAAGSLRPAIRLSEDGEESTDSVGIYAEPQRVSVGEPVTLSALIQDRGERYDYEGVEPYYAPGSGWVLHQGPAIPEIETPEVSGKERASEDPNSNMVNSWYEVATQVTFPQPGEYVIRLRADNFQATDSKFDNVCCWSNAYFPVTVNP
ncbi:MAG: hypothetical protein AB8B95_12770 [Pseudohongiellaceae bacterium]